MNKRGRVGCMEGGREGVKVLRDAENNEIGETNGRGT